MSSRVALGVALLIGVSSLAAFSGPVMAIEQVIGSPDIEIYSPDNRVSPGEETELAVYISNSGDIRQPGPAEYVDRVTTARALSIEALDRNRPFEVTTGRFPVGSVPQGTTGPISISLNVPSDAEPGTYTIPVRVKYAYTTIVNYNTGGSPEYVDRQANRLVPLTVHIEDRPRFEISNATTMMKIGGQGKTTLTIRNVGTQSARDATVTVGSSSEELTFGPQSTISRGISGQWQPGEARAIEFSSTISSDAVLEGYPLTVDVSYIDQDGIRQSSNDLRAAIKPLPEQTFKIANISSLLYVGEPGQIRGSLKNTGPTAVEDVSISYLSENPRIQVTGGEAALGRLARNETAEFLFDVRVGERVSKRTNQLNLSVRYRNPTTDRFDKKQFYPTVDISPEREWLRFTSEKSTFGVDTENQLRLRVNNVESTYLTDIQARLETSPPFTSESPQAFIPRLEPGETGTTIFGLTVSEDAVPADSSVVLNVSATRPDGEEIRLDPYQVPISVEEESATSNTTLFGIGVLVVVILLISGWWWVNR